MRRPPAIAIRLARAHEREALERIQWQASLAVEADRDVLLANPDAIDLPPACIADGRAFVAERDGAPAGFAVVLPQSGGDAELDGLFVLPDHWRLGIGRALAGRTFDSARALGAGAMHVVAGEAAAGFYQRLGFTVIGEAQTRFGPARLMRRDL